MGEAQYEDAYPSKISTGPRRSGSSAQVHAELERHGGAIDVLHQVITEMESRLEAVRAPRPEKPMNDTAQPMPVLAPLADTIQRYGSQIEHASHRLRIILDELEV